MNVIAEIQRINAAELENGSVGTSASWHAKYAASAWVYVGNLPLQLTEGDIICVMSQFGEVRSDCSCGCDSDSWAPAHIVLITLLHTQVEDINLAREENTGKSRGFAFLKYEDARSCVLAVDNLTGSKVSAVCDVYNTDHFYIFLTTLFNHVDSGTFHSSGPCREISSSKALVGKGRSDTYRSGPCV